MSEWREPTIFAETDRYDIKASVHENGLSIEFRLYDKQDSEDFWSFGGFLKWEGCLNWETNEECMAHYCEPSDHDALGTAFQVVGALAREHVRGYEGNWGTDPGLPIIRTIDATDEFVKP